MSNPCLEKLSPSNVEATSKSLERRALPSRVPFHADVKVPAPLITYVDLIELAEIDRRPRYASRTMPMRKCRHCHSKHGRSFSPRARRQRRRVIAQLDLLPIAHRARAAGLHGAALRAYVTAVAAVDGPAALME